MDKAQGTVEASVSPDDFNTYIGRISRAIEEKGFHWWTIYPKKIITARIGLHIELGFVADSEKFIRYGIDWDTNQWLGMLSDRLTAARLDMMEVAESEGVKILPFRRHVARCSWSTIGTGTGPQVCISNDGVANSAVK